MEKFVIIDDNWEESVLDRNTNPFIFDLIIEQKVAQVQKIILPDYETWWTMTLNSNKVFLIN